MGKKTRKVRGNFQRLEERAMKAGDVAVSFIDGDLFLQEAAGAEGAAQQVQVSALEDGGVRVQSLSGGVVDAATGKEVGSYVDFKGPIDDIFANLGGGDDSLSFVSNKYGGVQADDVNISTAGFGSDDDKISIDGLAAAGELRIHTGAGDDRIDIVNSRIGDADWQDIEIAAGSGRDSISIVNTKVADEVDVDTTRNSWEDAADSLSVKGVDAQDLLASLGNGRDHVEVSESNFKDDVRIDASYDHAKSGEDDDQVSVDKTSVGDELAVYARAGADRYSGAAAEAQIDLNDPDRVTAPQATREIDEFVSLTQVHLDEMTRDGVDPSDAAAAELLAGGVEALNAWLTDAVFGATGAMSERHNADLPGLGPLGESPNRDDMPSFEDGLAELTEYERQLKFGQTGWAMDGEEGEDEGGIIDTILGWFSDDDEETDAETEGNPAGNVGKEASAASAAAKVAAKGADAKGTPGAGTTAGRFANSVVGWLGTILTSNTSSPDAKADEFNGWAAIIGAANGKAPLAGSQSADADTAATVRGEDDILPNPMSDLGSREVSQAEIDAAFAHMEGMVSQPAEPGVGNQPLPTIEELMYSYARNSRTAHAINYGDQTSSDGQFSVGTQPEGPTPMEAVGDPGAPTPGWGNDEPGEPSGTPISQ